MNAEIERTYHVRIYTRAERDLLIQSTRDRGHLTTDFSISE